MSALCVALLATLPAADGRRAEKPFAITVVDEETGRGVPLVELQTVNDIRFFTDSNGVVAFHEPGLMGQDVFFHVTSHGYEFPKDGFGFRGKALRGRRRAAARQLKIKRLNIAERLYRVTGGGHLPRQRARSAARRRSSEPLLNGQVFGSDSVVNAVYRGKLYWFWGDTNRPAYPLGNFHVPGATSELPGNGGLDPDAGVDLDYFVDDKGFARPTAEMPGDGPDLDRRPGRRCRDATGRERLFASLRQGRAAAEGLRRGLAVFDDDKERVREGRRRST